MLIDIDYDTHTDTHTHTESDYVQQLKLIITVAIVNKYNKNHS